MAWVLLIGAWFVGLDAADKLGHSHPQPVGWFEGAVCITLILSAVIVFVWRGDE